MPLTVLQYKDLMRHAIGGDPDSRLDLLVVLNQALSFVVNCHDWKFRKRPPLDITFQAVNPATTPATYEQFVDLPSDFGELMDVCTKNNAIANIIMVTLQEIAWRRGSPNSVAYDGLFRCAISFPQQVDGDHIQPGPRLEIWPRPTASNVAGDLTLTYRVGAVALVEDNDVPNLPLKLERLLTLTARLFVQGYEEEVVSEDPLWQKEFAMATRADGSTQVVAGQLTGGAVQRMRTVQVREFQKITDPSNRTS